MVDESSQNTKKDTKAWWQPALIIFAQMSGWIVVPVLIGTLAGNYLDNKYNTDPWALISIVGVSFIISMVGIVRTALSEYKKIEKDHKPQKTDNR
jgi:F0F1-type ATP synthase assembly protein I